jgi:uncharacterized membrane protein YoaK (UPF0700 family)
MSTLLTDAWRTIVPPANDKHGPFAPLLLALTVVTGLVDAFSYLSLGHVFVANMTGNVVFLAFALAGAKGFSMSASLIALGAFSVGSFAGGRLAARVGADRGRLLAMASAGEALLAAGALVTVTLGGSPGSSEIRHLLIVLLALALGMQNATARKLAVPDLTTTVLTLTITGISADTRLAGGPGSRAGRRLLAVVAMFIGALGGALLVLRVSAWPAIAAALVALCLVAVTAAALSRHGRSLADAT